MCNDEQSKQPEVSLTTDNLYIANRNQNLYRSNFSATIPMYYQWFGILYKGCFTIMRLVLRQMHATSCCVDAGVCVCVCESFVQNALGSVAFSFIISVVK